MKIRSVAVKSFCADRQTDGQTDGYTDMTKLIVTIFNFVNVPKNWNTSHKCTYAHTHTHTHTHMHTHTHTHMHTHTSMH